MADLRVGRDMRRKPVARRRASLGAAPSGGRGAAEEAFRRGSGGTRVGATPEIGPHRLGGSFTLPGNANAPGETDLAGGVGGIWHAGVGLIPRRSRSRRPG